MFPLSVSCVVISTGGRLFEIVRAMHTLGAVGCGIQIVCKY